MRILLLRHGITEANEKHLYCGRALASGNARAGHTVYYERHASLQ